MAVLKGLIDPTKNHMSILGVVYNQHAGTQYASIKPHYKKYATPAQLRNTALAVKAKQFVNTIYWPYSSYWNNQTPWFFLKWWDSYHVHFGWRELAIGANTILLNVGLPMEKNPNLATYKSRISGFSAVGAAGQIVATWDPPPNPTSIVEIMLEKHYSAGAQRRFQNARLFGYYDADLQTCTLTGLSPGSYTVWWRGFQKLTGLWANGDVRPDGRWAYWWYYDVEVT